MTVACSACGQAVAGGDVLYTQNAEIVCPRCFARDDLVATAARRDHRGLGAGLAIGVIPFAFHVSWSSSTTVNGEVTSYTSRDAVALVCGALALLIALFAAPGALRGKARRRRALCGAVLALGAFQLAQGFGAFNSVAEAHEAPVSDEAPAMPAIAVTALPGATGVAAGLATRLRRSTSDARSATRS